MDKKGLFIGIIGGIGLGLLIGGELPVRHITILGAIMIVISLVSMIILSYRNKK